MTLDDKTASSDYVGQNTSGTGKLAILPPEIKGWNWGAFWLTWIWGIRNRTWIAFLDLSSLMLALLCHSSWELRGISGHGEIRNGIALSSSRSHSTGGQSGA